MTIAPFYILGADYKPVLRYVAQARRLEGMKFEKYTHESSSRLEAMMTVYKRMACAHKNGFALLNYAEKKCRDCGHLTDDRR